MLPQLTRGDDQVSSESTFCVAGRGIQTLVMLNLLFKIVRLLPSSWELDNTSIGQGVVE